MLADALAQYLVWKKWSRWVLIYGSHPGDALLADAYRRSAKRFGARIVKEREFKDTGGARQTDSGVVQTQQQMPVFTQGVPEYDVLVAADENEVFADYLPYRTWDARPVAGSAGLRPVTWDASSESWGGAQLQDRFIRMAFHRRMTALDMQAWTAVPHDRRSGQPGALRRSGRDHAGHASGRISASPPTRDRSSRLRDWDWQLRQPILLSRRPHGRLGLAAAGLPAPGDDARHARHRPAGDRMQTANERGMARWLCSLAGCCAAPARAVHGLCHRTSATTRSASSISTR